MKFLWEEKDIVAGRFARPKSLSKAVKQIGYCNKTKDDAGNKYGVTDVGSDGMFLWIGDKLSVAEHLNRHECEPVQRPQFESVLTSGG